MQRLLHLVVLLFISINLFAQAPQKMTYQAVIRNASNNLVVTAPVKMKISILQGSASGTAVYSELHNPTTNANGLVSIEIGSGTSPVGTIGSINWGNGTYFLKTETDPTNGTNYSIEGTSQLLSVPYALQANCVSSSLSGDTLLVGCKKYLIPGIKDLNAPPTLNNGLVAYYPFNGNANDESGNNNNGTVNGATLTTDRFDNVNKSYNFNGNNNYITISGSNLCLPQSEVTISVWVLVSQWTNNGGAIQATVIQQGPQHFYHLQFGPQYSGDTLSLINYQYKGIAFTSKDTPPYTCDIKLNQWNNFIFSYKNNVGNIFLNGTLIRSYNGYQYGSSFCPGQFFLGKEGNTYFNGKIDDLRIYNRALTQEEITYLANN
jgi:hypothetical protein